jgi:hypothetical protein
LALIPLLWESTVPIPDAPAQNEMKVCGLALRLSSDYLIFFSQKLWKRVLQKAASAVRLFGLII